MYTVQAFTTDNPTNDLDNPSLQIGSVTAYRLPAVFVLDLHVEKAFQIGSAVTISPILDCFNVANSHTVLQRDGLVGTFDTGVFTPNTGEDGNFNKPIEFLNGRAVRGGVRVSF